MRSARETEEREYAEPCEQGSREPVHPTQPLRSQRPAKEPDRATEQQPPEGRPEEDAADHEGGRSTVTRGGTEPETGKDRGEGEDRRRIGECQRQRRTIRRH